MLTSAVRACRSPALWRSDVGQPDPVLLLPMKHGMRQLIRFNIAPSRSRSEIESGASVTLVIVRPTSLADLVA